VGDNSTVCTQAGRSLDVNLSVRPTPNANFLRVEAQVREATTPILTLSTIVGRY
jgi:general secretion pathway protein I